MRATLRLSPPTFVKGGACSSRSLPDLLIVDLRLQGFNGLQLLHINPRPIPTIVVTGFPDDVLQADSRRLGAEYLLKPYDPSRLLALVGRLLDREPQPPDRRRVPRRPVTVDLPVEVNAVPARLLDASAAGVRFEIYRPSGYGVPPALTLYFPSTICSWTRSWSGQRPIARAGGSAARRLQNPPKSGRGFWL